MRSKEVGAVINKIEKFKTEKCLYKCFDDSDWQEASALLSYIQQLEKENKFLRDENNIYKNETVGKKRIRDEIKLYELEIETLKTLYPKTYTTESDYLIYLIKIQVLKNILEK